ncbi:MAG: homoserine dehydrogenase [bacterium]|nr:homoserine dehydrogenase [bacterium]
MREIRVGILGLGTVGKGVVNLLREQRELIKRRLGVEICVVRVADRSAHRKSVPGLPPEKLDTDAEGLIDDPNVDIVTELIGGVDDARKHILRAIERKKPVVTANKAVLAVHGEEIFAAAEKAGCPLCFEASVAGGIPIVRNLREGFAADRIEGLVGILNGTCNYILSEMTEKGAGYEETLKKAQELGYAEADPAFDVDGVDASHKIAILANLAYGTPVKVEEIATEGIRNIKAIDIAFARELGYRIRLLAIARETNGALDIRVHPAMLPEHHPLSHVGGVFNAVGVTGANAGPQVFIGQGAGPAATASAVVGDLIEMARWLRSGARARLPAASFLPDSRKRLAPLPPSQVCTCYYIRFAALDRPGVLSRISGVFGRHEISLESIIQKGRAGEEGHVPLVMMTHEASEESMRNALLEILKLDVVGPEYGLIRVEANGMAFA